MVTTQLRVIVNVNAAVTTDVAVTSEQRLVGQDNLIVSLVVKSFNLNINNARSFEVALCTVFTVSAAISSNYIA